MYVCVCVCKSLNHFAVLQKLTKLGFEDLFIYLWLCWVFLASCGSSSVTGSRGYSLGAVHGPLTAAVSLVAEPGLWVPGLWAPGLRELWHMGSIVAAQGLQSTGSVVEDLVVPQHVASSWTRNQTHVLCIGRWILYH